VSSKNAGPILAVAGFSDGNVSTAAEFNAVFGSCPAASPGRAERDGFEYFRHGTLSLYAALDVKTGKVEGKTAKRHTSAEFIVFLWELVKKARWAKQIHIVLDNLSGHQTQSGGGVSGAESESPFPLHADLFRLG
jgi:hypothetical protein